MERQKIMAFDEKIIKYLAQYLIFITKTTQTSKVKNLLQHITVKQIEFVIINDKLNLLYKKKKRFKEK